MSDLTAAVDAVRARDWPVARRLLTALVADKPRSIATFHLARVELELGRPARAEVLVDTFREWRPEHAGAALLAARIKLAQGRLDEARTEAEPLLATPTHADRARAVLDSVAQVCATQEALPLIASLDQQLPELRRSGPTARTLEAAQALGRIRPGSLWNDDPVQATVAFFHFAGDTAWALRNYDPHLIDVSTRLDYVSWPRRIQEHVRGASVLDVGCGFGGYGMGFLVAGARRYLGVDPAMDLDSTSARNKRLRQWDDLGVSPRQIMATVPAIRLLRETTENLSVDEVFDTITLHNVTEHLMGLEEALSGLTRWCAPDTRIVLHHHNFYSWNGHHFPPYRPDQIDLDDPEHQMLIDWRHVDGVHHLPDDHYVRTHLNRVRLGELRSLVPRHFPLASRDDIPSSAPSPTRLPPQPLPGRPQPPPDLTERDLRVNSVLAVATPRGRVSHA